METSFKPQIAQMNTDSETLAVADGPVGELRQAIAGARVPAELFACYKRLEAPGFADSERAELRRLIDRKFASWNAAAVGRQTPRWGGRW